MTQRASIYSRREKLADGVIHVLGIAASVAALPTLAILAVVYCLPTPSAVSLGIYGAGLAAVFSCSAAYHLTREGKAKALLRRFDHAAIYVKIAATYTPFALVKLGGTTGLYLLSAVWSITALGAAVKLFLPGRLVVMGYVLYLAQGWAIVTVWEPFSTAVPARVMALLAIGGILYTAGVFFHLWNRLTFHVAIWHGMVLAASHATLRQSSIALRWGGACKRRRVFRPTQLCCVCRGLARKACACPPPKACSPLPQHAI